MAQHVRAAPQGWTARGEARVAPDRRGPETRPLIVFGGIPGEMAEIKVTVTGNHQAHGYFVSTPSPDPRRVTPPCEKYLPCGGCPLMHVTPAAQRDVRRELVARALAEEGLGDVEVLPVVPSPGGDVDFRHVIKVGFGVSDHGHIRVGAWGRYTKHVVPVPNCTVAAPVLRKVMAALAHHVIDLRLFPYEPETGRGVMRAVVLRASRTTGEVLVTLVVGKRVKALSDLADRIAEQCSSVVGVWLHVNEDEGNAIFDRDDESGAVGVTALLGKDAIEEDVGGILYRIGPGDFFQTNPSVASVLYARTVERLGLAEGVPVLDLYCGVGGFALQAARATGWALGVEEVEGAVSRARESARRNGLSAEFTSGRVEEVLPDLHKRLGDVRPVITVNPARRGLEPGVVEGILALRPRRIAYVSCSPKALARDLAAFRAAGFTLEPIEPFDMFPNTSHVECLAVLTAADADEAAASRAPRRKVVRR